MCCYLSMIYWITELKYCKYNSSTASPTIEIAFRRGAGWERACLQCAAMPCCSSCRAVSNRPNPSQRSPCRANERAVKWDCGRARKNTLYSVLIVNNTLSPSPHKILIRVLILEARAHARRPSNSWFWFPSRVCSTRRNKDNVVTLKSKSYIWVQDTSIWTLKRNKIEFMDTACYSRTWLWTQFGTGRKELRALPIGSKYSIILLKLKITWLLFVNNNIFQNASKHFCTVGIALIHKTLRRVRG